MAGGSGAASGSLAGSGGVAGPAAPGVLDDPEGLNAPPGMESGTLTGPGSLAVSGAPGALSGAGPMGGSNSGQGQLGGSTPIEGGLCMSASSSGSLGVHEAGETIGGGRFVYFGEDGLIYKADAPSSLPAHGYIRAAVVEGDEVEVWQSGQMQGLAGLSIGDQYWLGAGGQPTNIVPTVGIHQPVGTAAEATILAVDIEPQIVLAP